MKITQRDRDILRRLAGRQAQIAALPVHSRTIAEWKRLNSLRPGRPLVWINEIPWNELAEGDESLSLRTEGDFLQGVEWQLRTTLYQWEHLPGDMVVERKFLSRPVVCDTGFGLQEESDVVEQSGGRSRHFHPLIKSEQDIEKIRTPEISLDREATEENYQALRDLFGDILSVERYGIGQQWFSPWDLLVTWYGVQEALTDLVLRPELIHAAMDRLVCAYLRRLEQYEELGLLSLDNGNFRIGSGGLGYTDRLPQADFNPARVRTMDQWGCATAQIFSEVSPAMHEEFALRYERRWLERFGLTYYGCCEPLHNKLGMLGSVPNLRKVSMSPRIDVEKAVKNMGNRYVFSYKPNPAVLATDHWNLEQARGILTGVLEKAAANGCVVEVILKDISTVRGEARRLWEWAEMAVSVAGEFAG